MKSWARPRPSSRVSRTCASSSMPFDRRMSAASPDRHPLPGVPIASGASRRGVSRWTHRLRHHRSALIQSMTTDIASTIPTGNGRRSTAPRMRRVRSASASGSSASTQRPLCASRPTPRANRGRLRRATPDHSRGRPSELRRSLAHAPPARRPHRRRPGARLAVDLSLPALVRWSSGSIASRFSTRRSVRERSRGSTAGTPPTRRPANCWLLACASRAGASGFGMQNLVDSTHLDASEAAIAAAHDRPRSSRRRRHSRNVSCRPRDTAFASHHQRHRPQPRLPPRAPRVRRCRCQRRMLGSVFVDAAHRRQPGPRCQTGTIVWPTGANLAPDVLYERVRTGRWPEHDVDA